MSNRISERGFTLIELLLVLSVLAVIATIAAPSMRSLLQVNYLRLESGRLLTALNLARSEAIMRNEPVSLCPSAMADAYSACRPSGSRSATFLRRF